MHLSTILALSLPILGGLAVPLQEGCTGPTVTHTLKATTVKIPITKTVTHTVTASTKTQSTTTSAAPTTTPTVPYTVLAIHSGNVQIHLHPVNAAGQAFFLGGETASYCPLSNQTQCPPGDVTAFLGLGAMDTEVPGGQLVYLGVDGHLGFTQAHSASYPPGAALSPLIYAKSKGATSGTLGTNTTLFGVTGFMACPTNSTAGPYQVFASTLGAIVPNGNISSCVGFDAYTSDYSGIAAWEYT